MSTFSDGNVLSASDLNGITQGTSIEAGAIALSKLSSEAWSSWSPTLTNITEGNGSTEAYWQKIANTVLFRILFTFGSTSSISASTTFSLPTTAITTGMNAPNNVIGSAYISAAGTPYVGHCRLNSSTTVRPLVNGAGGTYTVATGLTSSVPGTFTTADYIYLQGMFEAA